MRIAVMGAGAVGCYYGGMLARAGHPVVFIGRPVHVEAMRRDGLRLQTATLDERVAVQASTCADAVAGAALVLCCVKSTDTAAAARQMAPHLDAGTLVLSLQNGVDNAPRLRELLPQDVGAVVVYVAAQMAGPGHVRHHGRGDLVFETHGTDDALLDRFERAGIPSRRSGNVEGELWAKLAINCAYNALSALTQLPYGQMRAGAGMAQVMHDIVAECLAVAAARGLSVPGDCFQAVADIGASMAGQVSSTAQDLARGHPGEIDHLNGHVAREGARLGVPTPVNRMLHATVRLLEQHPPLRRPS